MKIIPCAAVAVSVLTCGAAMAQVSISGFADLNVQNVKTGGASSTRLSSDGLNNSRLVFTSKEDLGGGLHVKGVYEMMFNMANGNYNGVRESFVELWSPDWGSARAGRLNLSSFYVYGYGDPTFAADYSMVNNLMVFYAPYRASNALDFTSKRFGGFGFKGTVSGGAQDGTKNGRITSVAVDYKDGPLYVGLASDHMYLNNIYQATKTQSNSDTYLSVVYKTEKADWTAVLQHYNGYFAYPPYVAFTSSGNTLQVGTRYKLDELHRIHASVVRRMDKGTPATTTSATGFVVEYLHGLSKRTDLYATYATLHNDHSSSVTYPISWSLATPLHGENPHGLQFGIRHAF
jgi:predicted porin